MISTELKEALSKVASHPFVVVLITNSFFDYDRNYPIRAVGVIRANTNKQVLAFTGATSELDKLRALLENPEPSGFLVTTPKLFSGMEATSVIVLDYGKLSSAFSRINGLCRATTSLILIQVS